MAESRPFLDFKAIKGRAAIADVLARYHVSLVRVNQTSLKGTCPLPTHSSGSKNTFFVNEAKSVWCCHSDSCKKNSQRAGGNVIDFVALMEQCSAYAAAKRIDEMFPGPGGHGAKTASEVDAGAPGGGRRSEETNPLPAPSRNKALAFALQDVNPSHPMIQERRISVETAERFGVGFFPGKGSMAGRIVFPLHEDGHLVGYAGRTVLEIAPENPKWLLPKGLRMTFLYGLEKCDPTKALVLCESPWGVLWLFQNGMQAAALIGTNLTEAQEKLLEPFKTIIVSMDGDQPGREAAVKLIERLKRPDRKVWKAFLVE